MKISAEEISSNNKYHLIHVLSYDDVVLFVFSNIKKRNFATFTFFLGNILFLLFSFYEFLVFFSTELISWSNILGIFLSGFIIFPIILIPIHELIHAFMYKLCGARKIRFGINLSQYIFYVTADGYVTGFNEIISIAIAPFLIISGLLFYLFYFLPGPFSYGFLCTLVAHGTMCIGDFAILSFFLQKGSSGVVTYDSIKEKKAYFYKKN